MLLLCLGFFFTVIFFRFGLWAAIAAHYSWEALTFALAHPLNYSRPAFTQSRESLTVLVVLAGLLFVQGLRPSLVR